MLGLIAGGYVSSASATALVAEYNFSNGANLGADSSGHGNDQSVSGSVSQGSGPDGLNSAVFNGGILERTTGLNGFSGINGFTYTAWVNVSSLGAYNGVISQDFGSCCINRLLIDPSGHPFLNVSGHNDVTTSDTLAPQTWYFLALTAVNDGPNHDDYVYVNGIADPSDPVVQGGDLLDLSTADTWTGAGEGGGPYRLTGALADLRIYQGALSGADVVALYDSYSSVPEPASLILFGTGLIFLCGARSRRGKWSLEPIGRALDHGSEGVC
jgi:hypothetical protein